MVAGEYEEAVSDAARMLLEMLLEMLLGLLVLKALHRGLGCPASEEAA